MLPLSLSVAVVLFAVLKSAQTQATTSSVTLFVPPIYTLEELVLGDGLDVEASEKPYGPQTLPMHPATIPLGPGFSGTQLVRYNGPVLSTVNIFPIFYGQATNYVSRLLKFYADIADSPHFDWLAEYNIPSQPNITRGFVSGHLWDNSSSLPTQLQDMDIQLYIHDLIVSKTITPTKDSYFPIHFQPSVNILAGTQVQSCVSWCAYHSTMNISSYGIPGVSILSYGVIPDQGGNCKGGCGGDSDTFNNLCSVTSHELVESVTDPAVGWFYS
ncbi:UNVERIFIED_CONTAM: hypothetical protein HDU68_009784 [Siphonaria sp. JEL0065]|nr:hypothetical protein HDU68_009784 [Siphonaria sp. JEL0065]